MLSLRKHVPLVAACLCFAIGVYFRLQLYLTNRSLWLDPAALAVNVVEKSYIDLLGPLDRMQMAPPGFLLLSKLIGSIFNYSEYSLLFIPLTAGILSLVLIGVLSWNVLPRRAVFIPVGLLAFSRTAIYYSCEFKQYSSDMFFMLLIFCFTAKSVRNDFSRKSMISFTCIAATALWFSHIALIVSVGCGLGMLIDVLLSKQNRRENVRHLLITGCVLAANALACYLLTIRPATLPGMYVYHHQGFAPLPFVGEGWKNWHVDLFTGFFSHPLGFGHQTMLPILALVIGTATWMRKHRRLFIPLFGILLTTYLLSAAQQYPLLTGKHDICSRSTLFVLPAIILLLAYGIEMIARTAKNELLYSLLCLIFLFFPFDKARYAPPYWMQETRPLIGYIEDNIQDGDTLYVYTKSLPAFKYYTRGRDIQHLEGAYYKDSPFDYAEEADRLTHSRRSWILFSHCSERQRSGFLNQIETFAERKWERKTNGAWLYLYEKDNELDSIQ